MSTLRFGLFDAYLSTLGGGENFLAVLCEILEEEYPNARIDLLTYARYAVEVEQLAERFAVRLERTSIRLIEPAARPRFKPAALLQRYLHEREVGRIGRSYDLFVNNTFYSLAPNRARRSVYMCMFPIDPTPWALRDASARRRLLWAPYVAARRALYRRWISRYDLLLANSEFTRHWIRQLWRLDSLVLYPPVDTRPELRLDRKRKIVLAVGRFFAGNHNKKHDVLIKAFLSLWREGLVDWELHLVGGRTDHPGTEEYITTLQRLADGLPVHFHFDASHQELSDLLEKASLFWHATGYGESQAEVPEKLEHFGLSTVEAMTHGCVPLVFRCGGQTEVIDHGRNGFLWTAVDELVRRSVGLARDPDGREALAKAAHASSQRYGRETFRREAKELLRGLVAEPSGRPAGVAGSTRQVDAVAGPSRSSRLPR